MRKMIEDKINAAMQTVCTDFCRFPHQSEIQKDLEMLCEQCELKQILNAIAVEAVRKPAVINAEFEAAFFK